MKTLIRIMGSIAIGTTLISVPAGSVSAETEGDPLVMQAKQIMDRYSERGTWSNPMLAATNDEAAGQSGDVVMATILAGYTRSLLDRGGWLNPYAPTPDYDSGHALLAMAPGDGLTLAR